MIASYRVCTIAWIVVAIVAGSILPRELNGADAEEYRVKLAFIYNFIKFTQWPENAREDGRSSIVLGVLGEDPFGPALESLDGKVVGDRKLQTRRLKNLEEAAACRVLFVSLSEQGRLEPIMRVLRSRSILTVSDIPGFIQYGGVIGLVFVKNKVRFQVNVFAARLSGLQISSKLLRLAEHVKEND